MNTTLSRWIAASALAFAAGVGSIAAAQGMNDMPGMQGSSAQGGMAMKSMAALEKLSGRAFDVAYMSQMIEHHKGAVEMAQMCVKNCTRAEVKKAAQTIITDQQREIKQLTGWLKTWYKATPDAAQMKMMREDMKGMMDQAMGGMAPMAGMEMPVDRSFLEGMIPHHQDAVNMSKLALKKAARPELRKFAQGVIDLQTKEINQFKTWLKAL